MGLCRENSLKSYTSMYMHGSGSQFCRSEAGLTWDAQESAMDCMLVEWDRHDLTHSTEAKPYNIVKCGVAQWQTAI